MPSGYTAKELRGLIILLIIVAVAIVITIAGIPDTPPPLPVRTAADTAVAVIQDTTQLKNKQDGRQKRRGKGSKATHDKSRKSPAPTERQRRHLDEDC